MFKTENVLQWNALKYWIATNVNWCEPRACAVNLRHYTDFESPYSVYLCKVHWNEMFGLAWACYGLLVYNIRVCFSFLKLFELAALSCFILFLFFLDMAMFGHVWTFVLGHFLEVVSVEFEARMLSVCSLYPARMQWYAQATPLACARTMHMALHADSVRPRVKQGEANGKIGNIWKHLKKIQNEPQNGHMTRTCAAHGVMLCRHYVLLCHGCSDLFWNFQTRVLAHWRHGQHHWETVAEFAPFDGNTTKTIKGTRLTASKFLSMAWIPGRFLQANRRLLPGMCGSQWNKEDLCEPVICVDMLISFNFKVLWNRCYADWGQVRIPVYDLYSFGFKSNCVI